MRGARGVVVGAIAMLGMAACEALPIIPGVPPGAPQVVCQGVPQEPCRQAATVDLAKAPVRVIVRCTIPVCTQAEGDAEVIFQFADGSSETGGYGWASAPDPAVPQEPPVPDGT